MKISAEIKPALPSDAEEISRVIVRALRETNRQDYSANVLTAIAKNCSPERWRKNCRPAEATSGPYTGRSVL
jgi:hypothetical protein